MDSQLIPQGIEIVQKAIAADGEQDFEKALSYYRDALSRFTIGLKYEKNEARKKLIMERVEGYMRRAEELSDYLKKQGELDKGGGGGVAAKKKGDDNGDDEPDAETKKLRGALSSAIVSEKPNVSWEDVAGLDSAKESLKEVSHQSLSTRGNAFASFIGTRRLLPSGIHRTHSPSRSAHFHRRSFYRPNFPSYSRASANPSREFCSTDPPERVNPTSPRRWRPKPIPLSFPSPRQI